MLWPGHLFTGHLFMAGLCLGTQQWTEQIKVLPSMSLHCNGRGGERITKHVTERPAALSARTRGDRGRHALQGDS